MIIEFDIKKKYLVLFFIVVLGSIVIGYGSNNPALLGHTGEEVHVTLSNGSIMNLQEWVNMNKSVSVPRNAVVFFNGLKCPQGWSVLTQARGWYIVATLPNIGAGARVGTILKDLENRNLVGNHGHGMFALPTTNQRGNITTAKVSWNPINDQLYGPTTGPQNIKVEQVGNITQYVAPYVQYLPCQKK